MYQAVLCSSSASLLMILLKTIVLSIKYYLTSTSNQIQPPNNRLRSPDCEYFPDLFYLFLQKSELLHDSHFTEHSLKASIMQYIFEHFFRHPLHSAISGFYPLNPALKIILQTPSHHTHRAVDQHNIIFCGFNIQSLNSSEALDSTGSSETGSHLNTIRPITNASSKSCLSMIPPAAITGIDTAFLTSGSISRIIGLCPDGRLFFALNHHCRSPIFSAKIASLALDTIGTIGTSFPSPK